MSSLDFIREVESLLDSFPTLRAVYHRAQSGVVTLEEIICSTPGKGIGTAYLSLVVDLADRTDTVLRLVATPIGDLEPRIRPTGHYAIEEWYQRFGFVYENVSFQVVGMRRIPTKVPTTSFTP